MVHDILLGLCCDLDRYALFSVGIQDIWSNPLHYQVPIPLGQTDLWLPMGIRVLSERRRTYLLGYAELYDSTRQACHVCILVYAHRMDAVTSS